MNWSDQRCDISHPAHGRLDVDTTSGCPEVPASVALNLINRYEALVGKKQAREERLSRMMSDLHPLEDERLAELIRAEGTEAEGALRVLLGHRFPHIPFRRCVISPLGIVKQDDDRVEGMDCWFTCFVESPVDVLRMWLQSID